MPGSQRRYSARDVGAVGAVVLVGRLAGGLAAVGHPHGTDGTVQRPRKPPGAFGLVKMVMDDR